MMNALLLATAGQSVEPQMASEGRFVGDDSQLKQILLETIPLEEMGPYEHPWRAQYPIMTTDIVTMINHVPPYELN